jgi:hypothetical protein
LASSSEKKEAVRKMNKEKIKEFTKQYFVYNLKDSQLSEQIKQELERLRS